MVIVASEPIEAGREIRINYEHDNTESYWRGEPPAETSWRQLKVPLLPPSLAEPVINRLAELQAAAASEQPCSSIDHFLPPDGDTGGSDGGIVLPWDGPRGGDERLRKLVPLLSTVVTRAGARVSDLKHWAMVSTHLPGRTGRECRDRWLVLCRMLWAEAEMSDEEGQDGGPKERCCLLGCKRQLLRCYGIKQAGSAVGCAEESHILCVQCLERWFAAQKELRREQGVEQNMRRSCPVCQAQLRAVRGEEGYHLGLQKLEWSWREDGGGGGGSPAGASTSTAVASPTAAPAVSHEEVEVEVAPPSEEEDYEVELID